MPDQQPWKRIRERLELKLPVRVNCYETPGFKWTEITRLIDVTPYGARFTLKRPVEKGRLVHMTIPMPRQLRVFDHTEDQYRVWALVRYLKSTVVENKEVFEVGVAFIGKRPPRSYEEDPTRRYEVGGVDVDNLSIAEIHTVAESATSDKRSQTRHNIPVDMVIETFNDQGEIEASEDTITENISLQGAAIYTTIPLTIGRFIRLSSKQYNTSLYAAVRGRSVGPTGMPRIHVEFVDREWPL